jgi:hypothetical protein
MKKLVAFLLCVGLLVSSMASAIMSPKRLWQCRPTNQNPTPPCSAAERATSRKWLVGALPGAIAAVLTAFGIAVAVSEIKMEQELAKKDKRTAAETAELARLNAQISLAEQRIASGDYLSDVELERERSTLEELKEQKARLEKE